MADLILVLLFFRCVCLSAVLLDFGLRRAHRSAVTTRPAEEDARSAPLAQTLSLLAQCAREQYEPLSRTARRGAGELTSSFHRHHLDADRRGKTSR